MPPSPILIRPGHPADCAAVAQMVQELARDTGAKVVPKATAEGIAANVFGPSPVLALLVAEQAGGLIGFCLSSCIFSTWRNELGLYVVDLYVKPESRSAGLGLRLLKHMAADGMKAGARFLTLDVERDNEGAERFYQRLGFRRKDHETVFVLDEAPLKALVKCRAE
jgi:ribosomal protein S18 acetylase RimI-like enzyme